MKWERNTTDYNQTFLSSMSAIVVTEASELSVVGIVCSEVVGCEEGEVSERRFVVGVLVESGSGGSPEMTCSADASDWRGG